MRVDERGRVDEVDHAARDHRETSLARQLEHVFHRVSSYAVFCFDPSGLILTWNPGVHSVLGYSRDEFVGRHFSVIFTEEDRRTNAPQTEMTRALRTGQATDDRWHVRQDGSHVFVAGVITPVRDAAGGVEGFVKLIRDRTDVVSSAAHLRARRDQAESASREKDTFLAVLAHELRQPLAAIVGWARMGELGHVPPHNVHDMFGKIRRAADATVRFVNDLLDVSRIESGKLQLALEPTRLGAVVQDSVSEVAAAAAAGGIALTLRVAETCTVRADPVRFRHVVANLVGNAVKYTPRGGSIEVSFNTEAGHAVLTVADTGVGIAEDDLPFIFERFRQSRSADQKQSGLGLGLWVARQVVERHGGEIRAFSDGPGAGATFVVRIPCGR